MKCVVLGGAGFIGSHLVERLLAAGHAVRVFDLADPGPSGGFPRRGDVEWVRGDFLEAEDARRAIAGCGAAFHLAWTSLPKSSNEDPAADVEHNIAGTVRVLEAWRRAGGGKFVFISSGGTVYGVPRTVPITEEHPTNPLSSYGITKLAIEKYLELYRVLHALDYCVLRVANPYGERQRIASGQGAVTTFLHRAHRGEPIDIWGDGHVVRDYLYVGDVADALVRALAYKGERRVINVGSGIGRDLNEVVAAIERVLGRPVARRHTPGRNFDVPANVLDISVARAELGWQPATAFEDGLARTLRSFTTA
jgi:UDP-glucose 4-epimerase